MIKTLIDAGADVNVKTDDGTTPLIFAQDNNTPEIVNALKDAGAK